MGLSKDKLIYDSTTPSDGDSVAAFLRTGSGALTSTGAAGALDVNLTNALAIAVDLDGDYDGTTNLTPDSVGTLVHDRAATPAVSDQNKRTTGGAASSDSLVAANVHGADTNAFGMIFNGTTWDRMRGTSGSLNVAPLGNVADDAVDAGNPVKIGSRALSGALTAVSATGDRADLISDLYRRARTTSAPNIAGANAAVSVDTTAGGVALLASHAGREKVMIQNLGNKAVSVGFGTVTFANGIVIHAGGSLPLDIGPDLALKAIAESGTQDVRVLQLA
jgi:hypothetical protein